jgi:hypothetical protein
MSSGGAWNGSSVRGIALMPGWPSPSWSTVITSAALAGHGSFAGSSSMQPTVEATGSIEMVAPTPKPLIEPTTSKLGIEGASHTSSGICVWTMPPPAMLVLVSAGMTLPHGSTVPVTPSPSNVSAAFVQMCISPSPASMPSDSGQLTVTTMWFAAVPSAWLGQLSEPPEPPPLPPSPSPSPPLPPELSLLLLPSQPAIAVARTHAMQNARTFIVASGGSRRAV